MSKYNELRAARARLTLEHYAEEPSEGIEWLETQITDLLTDLRHLCDVSEIDIYPRLYMSYQHYLAEKEESDEAESVGS